MKKTTIFVITMIVVMCVYAMFLLKNDIPNEVKIHTVLDHHLELPFETPDASPWWNMIAFPLGIVLYFQLFNFEAVTGKEPRGLNPTIRIKHALKMTIAVVRLISIMFFELILLIGALTVFICGELGPGGGILSATAVAIQMFILCYFLAAPLVFAGMSFMEGYDDSRDLTGNYINQIVVLSKEGIITLIPLMIGSTLLYLLGIVVKYLLKIIESIKKIRISIKK